MNQEEVWDRVAEKWSEFRDRPVREVVEFLSNKKGNVLDLGCGSGRNFLGSGKLKFHGVDFSEKFVELASRKDYVEVKKGNCFGVPYGEDEFDYVIFIAALHCVESPEDRRKSLEEVYRILQNGGQALISVWSRNQDRVKNKPKDAMIPWTVGEEKFERYYYLYDRIELEELIRSVGFKVFKSWEDDNIWFLVEKSN